MVPITFSMMLAQASERHRGSGKPRRITVNISSSPSRVLAPTPGATCSNRFFQLPRQT
jgi:hypothetical protein